MKTAALGDTLLLAGFAERVRHAYPDAAIVLITGTDNVAAARLLPGPTDEHLVVSPTKPAAALATMRRARLDIVIDFGSWPRFDALLAALSGARYRIGFRTPGQGRHWAFDRVVDHSDAVHERKNYERLLGAIEVTVADQPPVLVAPGNLSRERLPSQPYVVFHPWSSGYMHEVRDWRPERWRELAAWARSRGWTVVLSGSPGEKGVSAALTTAIEDVGTPVVDAAGAFTIPELADVLVASQVVVSVNTGVAHLAGMLGAATVCLHGPTAVRRWGPLGPRVRSLSSVLPGCGYLNLGHDYDGGRLDCMDGISVEMVVAGINELVG